MNTLLITGSHPNVLNEIKEFMEFNMPVDLMAIGMDAVDQYVWPIKFMATYHPKDIPEARKKRQAIGGNLDYYIISHEHCDGVSFVIPFEEPSGSSSLLGATFAIRQGYKKIVLCGCPLQGQNQKKGSYEFFRKGWEANKDLVRGFVRSMSGWTAEFLGKPTLEWLKMEENYIDVEHKNKFETVWDKGKYRLGSTAQRLVPMMLNCIPESMTINDYGSGSGRAEIEIIAERPNQVIHLYDIASNALEFDLSKYPTMDFHCVDLCDLGNIPKADWGICINVLMTVQPRLLDRILQEIRRTCDNLFFEAYSDEDRRCGYQMTTVSKNKEQWEAKLAEYWKSVKFIKSPQSSTRYIFVCRG